MKKNAISLLDSNEGVFSRYLAFSLLAFFTACVAIGWLNQLAPVGAWSRQLAFPIALVASIIASVTLCGTRKNLVPPLAGTLILALLLYISTLSLDFSWDGLAYHQRAVIALLKGADFLSAAAPTGDLWVDNYAKATWFYGATMVSWFERTEFGASYHFVLAGAAASYLYGFCRWAGRGRGLALALALIVFFNPITIVQWFTYYNDAALGTLGVLLIVSTILVTREARFLDKVIFIASAVLVVNVKASGIILVGVAFLYFGLACLLSTRNIITAFKKVGVPFAVFFIVGIGLLGYSPYVQNVTHDRHVFYPLMGKNSVDVMTVNWPYGFSEKNRFHALFISIFSKSEDLSIAISERTPTLKVPGVVYSEEITEFWRADTRIGGFGPLYSLALVLGLLCFLVVRMDWRVAGPLVFMVLLAVIINPYAWWARYAPVLWIFPIIPLITISGVRFWRVRFVPVMLIVVMYVNIGLLVWNWLSFYPSLNLHVKTAAQALQDKHLKIYQGVFASDLLIDRLGLQYEKVGQEYYEKNKEKFHRLATGIEYEQE